MKTDHKSFFLLCRWSCLLWFLLVFIEIIFILIILIIVELIIVFFVIYEFVLFKLLISFSVEPIKNLQLFEATLKDILLFKNKLSVIGYFSHWILGKVELLKIFKLWKLVKTFKLLDFVFVEDKLAQILVSGKFLQCAVGETRIRRVFTCWQWGQ